MLTRQKVFDTTAPNKSDKIIEGSCSSILNWDDIRQPEMYKLYKVLIANHWIPSEIPMNKDKLQFEQLTAQEQETYKKIIGLLAVLDSMQTNFVTDVGNYFTDSSLVAIAAIINQQEVIHNQSYSYVLSSITNYEVQKEVFEYWKKDEILLERNLFIAELYQRFRDEPTPATFFEAVVADMILEGIFFYSGFAFFYHLARQQKMLGTSQMISYIQRDEAQHAYFFGEVFKLLLTDFPELNTSERIQYVYDTIDQAVKLEEKWAHYVLNQIDGIDLDDFSRYIRFIANKRLKTMGLQPAYEGVDNCMPWIRPFSDEALNQTKTDFFEAKSRTYAKVSDDNGFDEL
ncbi:ribonucleoside-diphosphate reductase subunit beta [Paenibacillus larvae subsp. larvae]|uniref:Ribonucleoside-diphosphate reductase subunit beta n=4 Tax=Paenibacillus larvae TaxID=1464 RepID=A0A1V0UYL0_9BACL|nr:ribonucleotide-diphosphate reductase subunit beta [Paenibacillus larvae]AQT83572.1 ribonucleotide-diphosphate reductase subunit beta [Paenibacillus larvae subsp. pulvifaciens]AQZ48676.1 ribonucleotide-diphosphate reductase subunit beta [Paenibacillus larvae subsp. pulvifaciens]ARF70010.1 ribonucleotide-diphosphate reductase subunit beta [Paenibacillus larvae subsp. pulvifaciens]AVF26755.1 ribonucleoside-diphosphate reductase subunit beta [Paenibacillus larvae subsp. larvae]AVF31502.1 ribonu